MEGLEQGSAVLTRSNSAVMAQLAQMNVNIKAMPGPLKALASVQTDKARPKKKVLLLELREKFQSQEKNLISKESGISRGSIL